MVVVATAVATGSRAQQAGSAECRRRRRRRRRPPLLTDRQLHRSNSLPTVPHRRTRPTPLPAPPGPARKTVMYNIFRLTGDGLHCLALIVLFFKMNQTGSCAGVSQFNCLFRCRLQQYVLILSWRIRRTVAQNSIPVCDGLLLSMYATTCPLCLGRLQCRPVCTLFLG